MAGGGVPKIKDLLAPTLEVMKRLGEPASIADIDRAVADHMSLSDEVLSIPTSNGVKTAFEYNMGWARTNLKKRGLVERTRRGIWAVTELGESMDELRQLPLSEEMASVPKAEDLMAPTLEAMKRLGQFSPTSAVNRAVADYLSLSDDVLYVPASSGVLTAFEYNMRRARAKLKKANWVETPRRGVWVLTESGEGVDGVDDLKDALARAPRTAGQIPDTPSPLPPSVATPLRVSYSIDDAMKDLFIPRRQFERMHRALRIRKNLILQGPPGTGKTFMAKRLAWCLIGEKNSSAIAMVQFHQAYAYEDFVQGYRPTGGGGFEVRNGVFFTFCDRARENPETPHVLIIDEINRGNLSRIFGELLMLVEVDKRNEEYAVSLTYAPDDLFYVPENLHVLGLMNTADRSLAVVDYALRRRFAFETLKPAFGRGSAFRDFLVRKRGVPEEVARMIDERFRDLNAKIAEDPELGKGFCIGHSYFVSSEADSASRDWRDWYDSVVKTQIGPLLEEYWFESGEKADKAVKELLA